MCVYTNVKMMATTIIINLLLLLLGPQAQNCRHKNW